MATSAFTPVIDGFPVSKGSGWSAQGPSGFAYWCGALPGQLQCKNKAKGR